MPPKPKAPPKPRAPPKKKATVKKAPKPRVAKPKPLKSLAFLRKWAATQGLPKDLTHNELIHSYQFMMGFAEAN